MYRGSKGDESLQELYEDLRKKVRKLQNSMIELCEIPRYQLGDKVQLCQNPPDSFHLHFYGEIVRVWYAVKSSEVFYVVDFNKDDVRQLPSWYKKGQRRYLTVPQHDLRDDAVCYMYNQKRRSEERQELLKRDEEDEE